MPDPQVEANFLWLFGSVEWENLAPILERGLVWAAREKLCAKILVIVIGLGRKREKLRDPAYVSRKQDGNGDWNVLEVKSGLSGHVYWNGKLVFENYGARIRRCIPGIWIRQFNMAYRQAFDLYARKREAKLLGATKYFIGETETEE